ncbi:MAG: hypothetical protein EOO04_18475 [Chitinophagaceae bacterium]|nr:MAG: hypothetical protein EOO04_18475 [Chitinophagaceae bacterium]
METFLKQTAPVYNTSVQRNTWSNFISWCTAQEPNRFVWLGVALAGHGCMLTPLTLAVILLNGNNLMFFMIAMVAMAMTLVTNLAAMPTKITIPVFLLSILVDVALIVATTLSL